MACFACILLYVYKVSVVFAVTVRTTNNLNKIFSLEIIWL